MSMYLFNDIFPAHESWVIAAGKDAVLPEGKYAFLEHYCANPECDCQACIIRVEKLNDNEQPDGQLMAEIHYEWNKTITSQNPYLLEESPPSVMASNVLEIFKELIRQNNHHTHRLIEHDKMIKKYFQEIKSYYPPTSRRMDKVGRNDPCPCGSGKKYKKCCITH